MIRRETRWRWRRDEARGPRTAVGPVANSPRSASGRTAARDRAPPVDDPTRTTGYMVIRSLPEAARECGVPEAALRRWVAEGALPVVDIGGHPMVSAAEVAALRDRGAGRTRRPAGAAVWAWLDAAWWDDRGLAPALGAGNVGAGVAGVLVPLALGPHDPRGWGWLTLCLANVVVGLLLWRLAAASRRRADADRPPEVTEGWSGGLPPRGRRRRRHPGVRGRPARTEQRGVGRLPHPPKPPRGDRTGPGRPGS